MATLIGLTLLSALFGALIGSVLPRFSAYFLGPLLLTLALLAGVALMRTNLHTEGSPAGYVVGGILVLALAIGGAGGLALTVAAAVRLNRPEEPRAPPP